MIHLDPRAVQLSESWLEGDEGARWRSGSGHSPSLGAKASGSSLLEVDPGCRLPRHTDSAEEVIAVISGTAQVEVGGKHCTAIAGSLVVVPKCIPHQVRNVGGELLRFAAIYAEPDVVTTYDRDVQPDGSAERHTVS